MEGKDQQTVPSVLQKLAQVWGVEVNHGRLEIPERIGSGYCRGYVFNEHIRMLILHYELHENLTIENPDVDISSKTILFKFQHIFSDPGKTSSDTLLKVVPSVLIATSGVNTDEVIPVHTNTAVINIEVDAHYLSGLFRVSEKSLVLQSLLQNTQPLVFEQMIYPLLQQVVDEIVTESVDATFELFFMRIKAEELICRLLMALEKRDEKHLYALNVQDVQTLYKVRDQVLEHLDTPPVIDDLAAVATMSPTKLKRLFKQIFGDSIFSYYQGFRIKEAARLLQENKLSVSDIGGRLGFTNLSHFSKVFHEHMGMNPKQYSRAKR